MSFPAHAMAVRMSVPMSTSRICATLRAGGMPARQLAAEDSDSTHADVIFDFLFDKL